MKVHTGTAPASAAPADGVRALAAAIGPWLATLLACAAFAAIAGDVLLHGWRRIGAEFLFGPVLDAGRAGGIGPVLASTGLLLLVCLAVALPLGPGTAAYLADPDRRDVAGRRWLRASLDGLSAVPSIVFGLFGSALFVRALGLGFSLLSGGLTLACMVLPLIIRSAEAGLRAVPAEQVQAAAALGMSRTATLFGVLLPGAAPAITAGVILAIGRAVSETAALLFTSGYVTRMPHGLLDSGRSLSVHVYDLALNVPGGEASAYGTALVLILLLVIVYEAAGRLTARLLGNNGRAA